MNAGAAGRGHPRDLVMIGAVLGVAAFAWAGWAQEEPPAPVAWRILLGALSVAGIALAAVSARSAIRHWRTATAIAPHTRGFLVYVIVFWAEVIAGALLAFLAIRAGRSDLVAPLILAVVGVHFFALATVFHEPALHLAAVLLTAIAVAAALLPQQLAAPSFWCGLLGAPVLLAIGLRCLLAGLAAFASDAGPSTRPEDRRP